MSRERDENFRRSLEKNFIIEEIKMNFLFLGVIENKNG